jgi:hypothetical protein
LNLYEILALHGFSGPFKPLHEQPGTVRDSRNRPIPFLVLPGVLDCTARRLFSERVADLLNEQFADESAARDAA